MVQVSTKSFIKIKEDYDENNGINFNLMSKYKRVEFIKDCGVNTINMHKVDSIESLHKELEKIHSDIVSVRSEGAVSKECLNSLTYYANVDNGNPLHIISIDKDKLKRFATQNNCIFSASPLYIYEGIPDYGVYAGAIYVKSHNIDVELCRNCYVREVTHDSNIEISKKLSVLNGKFVRGIMNSIVREIVSEVIKLPLVDFVSEVSYFKYPRGYYKRKTVVWDIGGDAKWHYKRRILM